MDLLGDIVEKDVSQGPALESAPATGFPALYEPEKVSSWKVRLQQKRRNRAASARTVKPVEKKNESSKGAESEAERIHNENVARMQQMSPQQLENERRELLESLDPKVLHALLKRAAKNDTPKSLEDSSKPTAAPLFAEIDGAPGTWIGGSHDIPDLPRLDDAAVDRALGIPETPSKHVNFKCPESVADVESASEEETQYTKELPDDDDVAPQEYQFAQQMDHMKNEDLLQDVHFMRLNQTQQEFETLDINDPAFDDKLHSKYFPDLPKESDKMAWMKPVLTTKPTGVIDDVSQCRFDFKGNLVPPDRPIETTKDGLHHHSEDPGLAGYTILELQHLSRSS